MVASSAQLANQFGTMTSKVKGTFGKNGTVTVGNACQVTDGAVALHAAPMFHLADMGFANAHWIEGNTHSVLPAFTPEALLDTVQVVLSGKGAR